MSLWTKSGLFPDGVSRGEGIEGVKNRVSTVFVKIARSLNNCRDWFIVL